MLYTSKKNVTFILILLLQKFAVFLGHLLPSLALLNRPYLTKCRACLVSTKVYVLLLTAGGSMEFVQMWRIAQRITLECEFHPIITI